MSTSRKEMKICAAFLTLIGVKYTAVSFFWMKCADDKSKLLRTGIALCVLGLVLEAKNVMDRYKDASAKKFTARDIAIEVAFFLGPVLGVVLYTLSKRTEGASSKYLTYAAFIVPTVVQFGTLLALLYVPEKVEQFSGTRNHNNEPLVTFSNKPDEVRVFDSNDPPTSLFSVRHARF